MAQVELCEKAGRFATIPRYEFPYQFYKIHGKIGPPLKPAYKLFKPYDPFKPIEVCSEKVPLEDLKRIFEADRQILERLLEESSLKLCSKLRVAVGLSEEFEADETALANLDGFLADLAGERVDASELVEAARRRL